MKYKNVIVFGDSLSDIGIKWKSWAGPLPIGWIARKKGDMTTNPSGRFSDCRNWTDFMYEDSCGNYLVQGSPAATVSASKVHHHLTNHYLLRGEDAFRYANYAEGGACGGIPQDKVMRYIALTTFKSQVKKFKQDYKSLKLATGEPVLCFVWFGANDLYTANAPANSMGAVAEKVALKRRAEIAAITGADNVRFVFVNLGLPLASVRYQRIFDQAQNKKQAADRAASLVPEHRKAIQRTSVRSYAKSAEFGAIAAKNKLYETRKLINNFESGALLYNSRLKDCALQNGDVYIDMASVVSKDNVSSLLEGLKLIPGTQPLGTSNTYKSAMDADNDDGWNFTSTSDEAHPTSRVYKTMWDHIKARLQEENISFGLLL